MTQYITLLRMRTGTYTVMHAQYITQLCNTSHYIFPLKSCTSMYTRIINAKQHIIQNTLFNKLSSVHITSSGPDVLEVSCGACSCVAPLRYSVRYGLFRLMRPGGLSSPRLRLSAQVSPESGGGWGLVGSGGSFPLLSYDRGETSLLTSASLSRPGTHTLSPGCSGGNGLAPWWESKSSFCRALFLLSSLLTEVMSGTWGFRRTRVVGTNDLSVRFIKSCEGL